MIKKGDKTNCPHCGEMTIVKQVTEMDGWTKKCEILTCALCGKKIADVQPETEQDEKNDKLSALSALLGGETFEKPSVSLNQSDRRFCKDCKFAVRNAFVIRCELSGNVVEAMDDCGKFEKRADI
jgi:DNA-directed RNA polymerase subunit RPC12/RpoP